jgi:hypothetical protein
MQAATKAKRPSLDKEREEQEQYLLSKGWTSEPENAPNPAKPWRDPTTGKPPESRVIRTDRIDGQLRELRQTYTTAPAWYYSLAEAVEIQRQRESNGQRN